MTRGDGMESYWDRRAAEDPFHYVDNRQPLHAPDEPEFWDSGSEVVDKLFDALGVQLDGHEDVVDLGCGIGRLTRVLSSRAASVTGIDVSQAMLDHARRYNAHLRNVQWIHGDGRTLAPLPDASFDACLTFVVFQHLPNAELTYGYIREMGRVLRPPGWGAFQVSTDARVHGALTGLARMRQRLLAARGRGPRDQANPAWLGSAVDIATLGKAAGEGGLVVERVEHEGTQYCLVLVRRDR